MRDLPPLQTHDFHRKQWVPPPPDRFCRLEPSDEKWAAFFGFGKYIKVKEDLFDVRDFTSPDFDLIGYTRWNPAQEINRYGAPSVQVPLRTARPVFRPSLRRDTTPELSTFQTITIHMDVLCFDRERFICWAAPLTDAEALIRTGWIESMGEDDKDRFLHDIRVRTLKSGRYW